MDNKDNKKLIQIKVHPNGTLPTINPKGDWIDLHSAEDVELYPPKLNIHNNEIEFQSGIIDFALSFKIPEGYELLIAPRSSTFKNYGISIPNSIGIIDNSYSGNNDIVKCPFIAYKRAKINKGDRIAQFRIIKSQFYDGVTIQWVQELDYKDRGGFGSTGV